MGISSRDYIRERPTGGGGLGPSRGEWAIKYILIANGIVFILQNLTGEVRLTLGGQRVFVGGLTDWFSLNLPDLYTVQVWRLLTYGFCHSPEISHIGFNLFVLWMFGRAIEPILGSREFLAFFLGGVIVSGLCHVSVQAVEQSSAGVVGASGGVMAVVFLTAMYYPRMKVLLFFVIPVELRWMAVLYAVLDVAGMFNAGSNVAHAAHLGGAAFGVAYKFYHWRITGWWDRLRHKTGLGQRRGSRSKVRIYQPSVEEPEENLDEQVDRILVKIKEQGEDSLTDKEREILTDASRKASRRLRGQ